MNPGLPFLLAYAFIASFVLGLLKTNRWITALIAAIVVWGTRVGQTEIDLFVVGTPQSYAWLGLLSAAVLVPTFVVAVIGSDLGIQARRALFDKDEDKDKEPENTPAPQAEEDEEAVEQ